MDNSHYIKSNVPRVKQLNYHRVYVIIIIEYQYTYTYTYICAVLIYDCTKQVISIYKNVLLSQVLSTYPSIILECMTFLISNHNAILTFLTSLSHFYHRWFKCIITLLSVYIYCNIKKPYRSSVLTMYTNEHTLDSNITSCCILISLEMLGLQQTVRLMDFCYFLWNLQSINQSLYALYRNILFRVGPNCFCAHR